MACLPADLLSQTQAVLVARLEEELPRKEEEANRFLWSKFAKRPEVAQFRSLTTEDWKLTAKEFEAALLQKAEALKLDATSLAKCLKAASKESSRLASVPVCAYCVPQGKELVWIIAYRWEVVSAATEKVKLSHVRVYAYDVKRIRKVGFVTCT